MKKFFKKTVNWLFDLALIAIMMASVKHAVNLPIGFVGIGYILLFGVALKVWTYKQGKVYYAEGIRTGQEIQRIINAIFVYADDGEDEFKITTENEVIFSPNIKFLMQNIIVSPENNYKYKVASMINHGNETEVTFTKIND